MQDFEEQRAAELAQTQQVAEKEAMDKKNWMDDALKGAKYGSSVGSLVGPVGAAWGALIGGAVGTVKGQYEAVGQRKKEGQSTGQALLRTQMDTPVGNVGAALSGKSFSGKENASRMNWEMAGDAAATLTNYYGAKAKADAKTSTAIGAASKLGEAATDRFGGDTSPAAQDLRKEKERDDLYGDAWDYSGDEPRLKSSMEYAGPTVRSDPYTERKRRREGLGY